MLYSAMLVSTIQQSESVMRVHMSPLWGISFPFRSHRALSRVPCVYSRCSLSFLYIISTVYLCQLQPPNSSHSHFPFGNHKFVLYYSSFGSPSHHNQRRKRNLKIQTGKKVTLSLFADDIILYV